MTKRHWMVYSAWMLGSMVVSDVFGIVKFTYPKVVDEVHFATTRTVTAWDGKLIRTQEGDTFRVLPTSAQQAGSLNIWLPIYAHQVGLERTARPDEYVLSYKRHSLVCGTPFSALLTVPLIPVKVSSTYRVDVPVVKISGTGQPPGTAR